jgi:ATP-dependent helicase/nuclease subunit B
MQTVGHLLAVVRWGWQRDDVLAFLKSSYTLPDKIAVDGLRRRACKNAVRSGREAWLKLTENDPQEPGTPAAVLRQIAGLDDRLRVPNLSTAECAGILDDVWEEFGLMARMADGEPRRQACDHAARQAAQEVLSALAEMGKMSGKMVTGFPAFHDQLMAAWQTATAMATLPGNLVRVYEPYDTRQRPLRAAIVMGLTERIFPRRVTEDPFFRDEERRQLSEAGGIDLEEMRNRADDERLFFYLAVTAPSETLILSYPRSSDSSDTLPSFYLDEVRAVITPQVVSRTLADVAPRPEEILSPNDKLLAGCAGLFDPVGGDRGQKTGNRESNDLIENPYSLLKECLAAEPDAVRAVLESRFLPRLPRLECPELRRDFTQGKRAYSVTELETYNRCPFQYLLRHVLKLRPETHNPHAAHGTLLHTVLRRWFRKRKAENALPADAETMQTELCRLLDEVMETERLDLSPHQKRISHRLLSDSLQGFAKREERFGGLFGMDAAHFELAFGLGADGAMGDEDRETVGDDDTRWHDPASVAEPLEICAKDGGPPVAICGVIDRVDYTPNGEKAMVLDYKLGAPPGYDAILNGDSLQMPIYLMAMEKLFATKGAAACYDSMTEKGRPRMFRAQEVSIKQFAPIAGVENGTTVKPLNHVQFAEVITNAEYAAIRAARGIEQGRIEAVPGDHCKTCAYGDICRTTLTSGHDGEQIASKETV